MRAPPAMLAATTPEALEAVIATFEALHPKPSRQAIRVVRTSHATG
ncbi:MAG TPA: hypothetical protein VFU43_31095 [Streptosporangiaceae bacterium]|nr:hypothetical protein [Streptosporangiaceae bacterium]